MSPETFDIVIIGAGPTGLGAAWRLNEVGHESWCLIETGNQPGGLAGSAQVDGFTWDLGGHITFSHYEYFDRMLAGLPIEWLKHDRSAWVHIKDRLLPYPLQNNIWQLPESDLHSCLSGLLKTATDSTTANPQNFQEWILNSFGTGLAELFFFPYNTKVWAYEPAELCTGWMGERIATLDLRQVLSNVVLKRDDGTWGPNSQFLYPATGGTGTTWRSIAKSIPPGRIRYRSEVESINAKDSTLTLTSGETIRFKSLISSMPIDRLLLKLTSNPRLQRSASKFMHSSCHIVGLGMDNPMPPNLKEKCWLYFPEANIPFYRVTVLSNYSQQNVARPGHQWSLLLEVSESAKRPVNSQILVPEVEKWARKIGLIPDATTIAARWQTRLEYGYPTPFLGRDKLLSEIQPTLESLNIYSRGRFGGWKYEVSNQDHSCLQGVEAINKILYGSEELTYTRPDLVNSGQKIALTTHIDCGV